MAAPARSAPPLAPSASVSPRGAEGRPHVCAGWAVAPQPIPYRAAIAEGATHVLVLRTRPDGTNLVRKQVRATPGRPRRPGVRRRVRRGVGRRQSSRSSSPTASSVARCGCRAWRSTWHSNATACRRPCKSGDRNGPARAGRRAAAAELAPEWPLGGPTPCSRPPARSAACGRKALGHGTAAGRCFGARARACGLAAPCVQVLYAEDVLRLNEGIRGEGAGAPPPHLLPIALQQGERGPAVDNLQTDAAELFHAVRCGFARAYEILRPPDAPFADGWSAALAAFPDEIIQGVLADQKAAVR